MTTSTDPFENVDHALRTARLICIAMGGSVVLFAAVALAVTALGSRPAGADPAVGSALFFIWIGLLLTGVVGGHRFWRNAIAPVSYPDQTRRARDGEIGIGHVQTNLIISWALIEAAGLFGVIVFFLTGNVEVLAGSLLLVACGAAVTFPRREWYEPFRQAEAELAR